MKATLKALYEYCLCMHAMKVHLLTALETSESKSYLISTSTFIDEWLHGAVGSVGGEERKHFP